MPIAKKNRGRIGWCACVALFVVALEGCDSEGAGGTPDAGGGADGAGGSSNAGGGAEGSGGFPDAGGGVAGGGFAGGGAAGGGAAPMVPDETLDPCPPLGAAEGVLQVPGTEALRADSVPVLLEKATESIATLELDPLGAPSVTVYYTGTNSVIAVWSSEEAEEYVGCEQRNEWKECSALTVREVDTSSDATYSLEVAAFAEEFWIVAVPTEDAPFACVR